MFAMLLDEYIVEEKCLLPNSDPNWISSKHERVFTERFPSGFTWTKARFLIEGTLVEVVHIGESAGIPDSLDGEGIWEGGKYVWELTKEVHVIYQIVKTVPLEIQIESNLRRNRQDRVNEIVDTLHRMGVNETLLIQALSINHQKYRDTFVNV